MMTPTHVSWDPTGRSLAFDNRQVNWVISFWIYLETAQKFLYALKGDKGKMSDQIGLQIICIPGRKNKANQPVHVYRPNGAVF